MRIKYPDPRTLFDRGVVILSLDTEQMWGYFDHLSEPQFQNLYPSAVVAHERLLECLVKAGVSATWFVVGGMALDASDGGSDHRMAGLPLEWARNIPVGSENTMPLWYRRSFVNRLREARPLQEIGLHAGLTHFIWTDRRATANVVQRELAEGVSALGQAGVRPLSFSFGREQEAFHMLLPEHGIRSYRGRTPVLACKLGRTLPGALLRALDEIAVATPPPVWPHEAFPGLWNIPSSLFLYPIGASRARIVRLRSRLERFSRGLEAAARYRGIFHFCLHPENLAESQHGFSLFDDMLERLIRSRDSGEIEILTVNQVAARMDRARGRISEPSLVEVPAHASNGLAKKHAPETALEKHSKGKSHDPRKQSPHSRLPKAHRCR